MSPPRRGERQPLSGRHVALLERKGRFNVATPLFEPGPQVAIERGKKVRTGRIAWVEFGRGRARIMRDLGSPGLAADVSDALVAERQGGRGFSKALEREAERVAAAPAVGDEHRTDLTGLATFTVDPATARDFDDAVSAEAIADGDRIRLWIHIADVAAYVRPGSDLDAEALARANSTYVPSSVEPMLPLALSAGVCSLSPGQTRRAVTTEIELDGRGGVAAVSFYRSLIRSDARLDYDRLDRVFSGAERAPGRIAEPLELARKAAAALGDRREGDRLEVNTTEPEFAFDEGEVTGATAVAETEAHRLIERLMVLTNEQVAALLERKRVPTLYRVHERPDPDRVLRMLEQLAALELPAPPMPKGIGPTEAGELVIEASRSVAAEAARRGHGSSAYSTLLLRAMKPARYSERNLGHAGLGSDAYTHFTSPIRRYPDLIVHRGLLHAMGQGEGRPAAGPVAEAAVHCSAREREASLIERDADDICAAFLLERELKRGDWRKRFEGEVSGLVGAGAFVRFGGELGDVYEGFLPARRMRGERYDLNETETALVGAKSGAALRFGDPVPVRVDRVEPLRGRTDLEPAEAASRPRSRRR